MKINIIKLVPKNWLIKDLGDKIEVTYKSKRGNYNRKAFVFPKEICMNEKFMEGIGLYLGDGDLNRKEKGHLGYCSKDKDIAKYAFSFLQSYFNVKIKDITFLVQYKTKNKKLKEEWASYLSISKEKILTRFSDRHRNECLQIQVNGVVFRKIFELVIKEALKKDFINNKKLRRGILRGLFAAEGNIGIDYIEKKPYISQIDFNLHINENKIKDYICKILELENIGYRISKDEKDNSLVVSISNWNNYLKLWKINIFDLCKRKKNKFEEICLNLNIHFNFNNKFREEFFKSLNIYQKDIAKIIGSWQANVSRTIDGIHLLKVEQLNKLLPYSNFTKKEILNNLDYIRIGSLTNLKPNKDILEFLKTFKSF